MQYRPELEWLCGMAVVNHHTLSDFRVCHAEALEQIFTQVLAEFPNAWLKERMGARKFRVRGLRKARAELLWTLLAYNIAQWIRLAWKPAARVAAAA